MNRNFFGVSLLGSLILSATTVLMGLPGAAEWEEKGWIISTAAGPGDRLDWSPDPWESWQWQLVVARERPEDPGESSPVAPIPPSGEELYQIHREGWQESLDEIAGEYQELLAEKREVEWELLHLPARPYPAFYQWLRADTLMPGLDRLSSQANYLFWILSGALFTAGLYHRLAESSGSREALRALAVTLLLIFLMGVAGSGLRWADGFVTELADGLSRLGGGEGSDSEYHHLVAILTGVETSLSRSREVIWREEDSPRAQERSAWTPARNLAIDLMDFLLKTLYLVGSWVAGIVAGLTLLLVVILEQFRYLLIHLGYALAPVGVALWALPGLRVTAFGWTRLLIAVLLWPVGWVLCFHLGNLLAGPLVQSWIGSSSPLGASGSWYEPDVLGVQLWLAFLEDNPGGYLAIIIGVVILCLAILVGLWLVTTRLHRLLEYGSLPWSPTVQVSGPRNVWQQLARGSAPSQPVRNPSMSEPPQISSQTKPLVSSALTPSGSHQTGSLWVPEPIGHSLSGGLQSPGPQQPFAEWASGVWVPLSNRRYQTRNRLPLRTGPTR